MSEIYLIRHGQASFGEENYDKLSLNGVKQAQILARHLSRTGKSFDQFFSGRVVDGKHPETGSLAVFSGNTHDAFIC